MEQRLSHVAESFRDRFGISSHSGAPSQPQPPSHPPMQGQRPSRSSGTMANSPPPPVPPRPGATRMPSQGVPVHDQTPSSRAGAIYSPGTYPTPELPYFPLQRHRVLDPQSPDDYTSATIQSALDELGPSTTVYLPPRTIWKIHKTIKLEDYQEIATYGYPFSQSDMAILDAQDDCTSHIIHAFDKSGIRIRNLVIEGNKEKYGWDDKGGVMIQLGGGQANNQVLDHCVLRNPRHWSCVQAFEGAHNVRITNNFIGPAGVGSNVEQMRWADGISYAASDGLVAGNLITDATDGGIVLFNATGTLITSNTVVTKNRLGLGAINMVDYIVNNGNYTFTRVTNNTIVTAGTMLKVGIGQGLSVWWAPDKRQVNYGGLVSHNLITRDLSHVPGAGQGLGAGTIGYGFPVGSDVAQWTCIENVSDPNVIYSGDISSTLPGYLNASPGPFVHDRYGHADGDEADMETLRLQPEFVHGKVWGLLAIKPGPSRVLAYDGGGLILRRGESIHLAEIDVVFREDAELCVCRARRDGKGYGEVLWEAGIKAFVTAYQPGSETLAIHFTKSGKLCVIDWLNPHDVRYDLTPHVPSDLPPSDSKRPSSPRLLFSSSSDQPYVSITSPAGDLLFASSYTSSRFAEWKFGRYIARPTPHVQGGGALIWTLAPNRRFVVIHVQHEVEMPLRWPLDTSIFHVVCDSVGDAEAGPEVDDRNSTLVLQGDGHLVLYDGTGQPRWGSGTHGDRGAHTLRFGLDQFGGPEPYSPYLELLNEHGQRLWST